MRCAIGRPRARVAISRLAILGALMAFGLAAGSARAGDEFDDANQTTFDGSVVALDNDRPGETTFSIDSKATTIGWQDLQQPSDNTLTFQFSDPDSIVLNEIGAQHPSRLEGTVLSNGTVAFANPFGVFIGEDAVIDVGYLVAVGASVSSEDFLASETLDMQLTGSIENEGLIRAEGNVALLGSSVVNRGEIVAGGHILAVAARRAHLDDWNGVRAEVRGPGNFLETLAASAVENHGRMAAGEAGLYGRRIVNYGEIEIADHSLLMVAADAVWVTQFDNPVLVKVPHQTEDAAAGTTDAAEGAASDASPAYAIENHGRIDAGRGHVRLAASDPLGLAIRQGSGSPGAPASIAADRIQIEGGENGRVQLSGEVAANDFSEGGRGGAIDVTGSLIVLDDATIEASGASGGGTIHVGGEQQGTGDLQRARAVVVDADSAIRADATEEGDGGRVIVFAEDLASVDGRLSARGGAESGDGGFVETSGLRHFSVTRTPDVSAPRGAAGSWLIDPFNISIVAAADPTGCVPGAACLDQAIQAILDPDFDDAGFDGILRTVEPTAGIPAPNEVTADLIAAALATGTSVTLSTQVFGTDTGTEAGDIDILDEILITNADTLEGTVARLTLLAAGDINVDAPIRSVAADGDDGRANLALSIELRANDLAQIQSDQGFDNDLLRGDVNINQDIRTGGGDITLAGASVVQQAGLTIDTNGGSVDIRTGTIGPNGEAGTISRRGSDPEVDPMIAQPLLQIAGTIDTTPVVPTDVGGDVSLIASSLNVSTSQSGPDPLDVVTGLLSLPGTSSITTGGGDVQLAGGSPPTIFGQSFAGDVELFGDLDSGGGNVTIAAMHVDPDGDNGSFRVEFVEPSLGEGGTIDIDLGPGGLVTGGGFLSIGDAAAQTVLLDGDVDTRDPMQPGGSENGLVQIIALDIPGVDADAGSFGDGMVAIGSRAATTISTSGLTVESRDVRLGEGAGVDISATGSSSAEAPEIVVGEDDDETTSLVATSGLVEINGSRGIVFDAGTGITSEAIAIAAATQPLDAGTPMAPLDDELRLAFLGANGAGQTAADGVRLNGDRIAISIGDRTTTSADGFSEDVGTPGSRTDFGLQRLTTGAWGGLQMRSATDPSTRPAEWGIAQDADLTITNAAPASAGEINLADVFDAAEIGVDGMRATLESSDGVLRIEDAAALNNGPGVVAGSDDDRSWVVLNGGLFLPDAPNAPTAADDTVVFRDGVQALGAGGTTAFDVESLTVSTVGDFTVSQQILDGIAGVNELVFEAGRLTEGVPSAERGTLTVDPGLTLQADEQLRLLAAAHGFGTLDFSGAGITLSADAIELRAGAGVDSDNTDPADRARIEGLQANVTLQDAGGGAFGDAGSTATAFTVRQDATIDGETDLPDLAQFGLAPATGFRDTGDLAYTVRSDAGQIVLDDDAPGTDEGARFRNAALSLFGLDASGNPAVQVSDEFTFVGKRVELGGIGNFTWDQSLATAFNRSGMDADEMITLRAGIEIAGALRFNRGSEASVLVKAPTVNLVAGNGFEVTDEAQFESTIDVRGATFDLAGPVGSVPTFVYHTDSELDLVDLPTTSQFLGGNAGLPDVLALRTDLATIDFDDFDATTLPLDLTDDPGRLVLEAESVTLSQSDGGDLELTSIPNLNLRLRTNNLFLIASDDGDDTSNAVVLIGPRPGDTNPTNGPDAVFDDESLLIEAFDREATIATTANLSVLSADPDVPGEFDLDDGRSPTTITLTQDGAVTPANLFLRASVAGRFARSAFDDEDGDTVATVYSLTSINAPATIEPENVNDSSLIVTGVSDPLDQDGIVFAPGTGPTPGVFTFESLEARTIASITIADGTQLLANDVLTLAAGELVVDADDPGTEFGMLRFEGGGQETVLGGNRITLIGGPNFTLDLPDDDGDGEPDPIMDADLPRIDFTNLDRIALMGDPETSSLGIRQSASLDTTRGGTGDYLTPLEAGLGGEKWESLSVDSVQGNLDLFELAAHANAAESFVARNTRAEGSTTVRIPDQAVTPTPFDDFEGPVEIQSNDVTFVTTDPGTSIDLESDNLTLVSFETRTGFESEDELGRLRGDDEIDDRPIVTIQQVADFGSSTLPRPDQYEVVNARGDRLRRSDLSGLDIRLRTTGSDLTLDDAIRARVTRSNLILESAGDVAITIDGATPGFDPVYDGTPVPVLSEYAQLQLTSLEIVTPDTTGPIPDGVGDGFITIAPTNPTETILGTLGDQLFDGIVVLDTTFSTEGRDIAFANDVTQGAAPDSGLRIATAGTVNFQADVGASGNALDHLWVGFDQGPNDGTPTVQFGRRIDTDGDGIAETPVDSDQEVWVQEDILFAAYAFSSDVTASAIQAALDAISTLDDIATELANVGLRRTRTATLATIGKALGDLELNVVGGNFIMASGEKLSVGGTATVNANAVDGLVSLGDVSALGIDVTASGIGLMRRPSGVNLDRLGETQQDAGASISANTIAFNTPTIQQIGSGRGFRFGLPDPFDTAALPAFLRAYPAFEIKASGAPLDTADFRFVATTGDLADRVPSIRPQGASRSDLSGAFGPRIVPVPESEAPDPVEASDADRLAELSVEAVDTPPAVLRTRLREAGFIDDLDLPSDDDVVVASLARLDASDADEAITLHEQLFGPDGERAGEIRAILQDALDLYLANTRARRVIGFELRRFVKNRPSTLLEAYRTLEQLDALFRYHRRVGLSPGEYRRIQRNWLREIRPDGISLDELSEAIQPSRYVRGSDILDIFGR